MQASAAEKRGCGNPEKHDNARNDIENVVSGFSNDVIIGSSVANALHGEGSKGAGTLYGQGR